VAGQADAPRPWSRYSAGSSRHDAAAARDAAADGAPQPQARPATALRLAFSLLTWHAPAQASEAAPKAREAKKAARAKSAAAVAEPRAAAAAEADDPQLAEFLALMQPRRAQKLWVRPAFG
jgi:hypothetical protein